VNTVTFLSLYLEKKESTVSLKILLADDSMTAQNMGKKILTEAGYDVTTVSNGAAAVKKVTEIHPDILVLDIYMPGYSGLEVCERVKAALDTARTPVLLTVGKMEPFRPEDGMRVKADGVIIKPFEATDLIAVVKKLADRIAPPAPVLEEGAALTLPPVDSHHWGDSAAAALGETASAPAKVHVPEEMAVIPAMGMELDEASGEDGRSASRHEFQVAPPPPPPPMHAEFEAPGQFHVLAPPPPPPPIPASAIPVHDVTEFSDTPASAAEPGLEQFTHFSGQIAETSVPDLEFTSAAPQDVTAELISELEPTIETSTDAAGVTDPLLASSIEQQEMTTKFGGEEPQASAEDQEPPAAEGGSASLTDLDDFESRLAAAMAAYEVPEQSAAKATESAAGEPVQEQPAEMAPAECETAPPNAEPIQVEPQATTESPSAAVEPEPPQADVTAETFADDIDAAFSAATLDSPHAEAAPLAAAAAASVGVPIESTREIATPPSAPLGRTSFDDELTAVMERTAAMSPVYDAPPALQPAERVDELPAEPEPGTEELVVEETSAAAVESFDKAETEPATVAFEDLPSEATSVAEPELVAEPLRAETESVADLEPVVQEVPQPSPESSIPAEESMVEPTNSAYPEGFPEPVMPAAAAAAPADDHVVADAIVDRVLDRMRPVIGVLVKELLRELKK
jgi:CheY-like chemotaxis protein